jgi:hypothetical protein
MSRAIDPNEIAHAAHGCTLRTLQAQLPERHTCGASDWRAVAGLGNPVVTVTCAGCGEEREVWVEELAAFAPTTRVTALEGTMQWSVKLP